MLKYTTKRFEAECGLEGFVADCVDVPKFQKFCRECPSYGNSWMCPPFSFDPMDIWRGYERIKLICVRINIDYPSEETSNEAVGEVLRAEKTKLMKELWAAEREVPGSLGLFAGSCSICETCAREAGEPCRVPERALRSIESIGADVGLAVKKYLGIEIKWAANGRRPEYHTLVAAMMTGKTA